MFVHMDVCLEVFSAGIFRYCTLPSGYPGLNWTHKHSVLISNWLRAPGGIRTGRNSKWMTFDGGQAIIQNLKGLLQFPDEILLQILSHLDAWSLVCVSTVSLRLYLLAYD